MFFVLGGNGTHAGANAIHNEVTDPLALFLPNAFDTDNFVPCGTFRVGYILAVCCIGYS